MSSDRILPPAYSLGQCIERLPLYAQQKYEALKALLADAEALQRSLQERIKAAEERLHRISRQRSYGNDGDRDGELEAARSLLEKLDKERSRRNSVRGNVEQTCSRLDVFLMQWFSGASDITVPPWPTNVPGAREGESITDALLRVRREIAVAMGELQRLRNAPPPKEEVQIAVIEAVDALAREGRPLVTLSDGRKVSVCWPDIQMYASPGQALSAPSGSASRLVAWVFRDQLLKKLIADVEDNGEGGIPVSERPQRIREVEERILALEIAEERLVMAALEQGLEVHRRIDVSPWVLLGYGLVEEAVPAEAAE